MEWGNEFRVLQGNSGKTNTFLVWNMNDWNQEVNCLESRMFQHNLHCEERELTPAICLNKDDILQLFNTARMNYSKRQIMSLPPSSSFPDFADTYLEHLKQALWKTSLLLSSRTTETRPSSLIKNPHTAHFSSSSVRSCRDLDWRLKKLRRNREGE